MALGKPPRGSPPPALLFNLSNLPLAKMAFRRAKEYHFSFRELIASFELIRWGRGASLEGEYQNYLHNLSLRFDSEIACIQFSVSVVSATVQGIEDFVPFS
jgi:hypothetical protein